MGIVNNNRYLRYVVIPVEASEAALVGATTRCRPLTLARVSASAPAFRVRSALGYCCAIHHAAATLLIPSATSTMNCRSFRFETRRNRRWLMVRRRDR